MSIQHWLGDLPKTEFVADYYNKLPYSQQGGGRESCHLGSWDAMCEVLAHSDADVMVVRQGQQRPGPTPRTSADVRALIDDGYTLLVRHAEQHHAGLSELAAEFCRDFAAPVNIHMYATPGRQFGFGWHYDAEEVFILQTTGKKEYSLRKNTVNPWPLVETIPADMQYERELMPLMKCLLAAGDWLYIPAGYWHMANVLSDETAISLAIGVMAPAAIAVHNLIRDKLLASLLWRQRLPTVGVASPLNEDELRKRYGELLQELSRDLQRTLSDEALVDELLEYLQRSVRSSNNPIN